MFNISIPSDTKILVVDDYEQMRRVMRSCLKELGLTNIVEAKNGVEALEALNKDDIEFIISDLNMPEMDGLELLQQIRKSPDLKDIPMMLVTAESERTILLQAIKAGINNYMIKPFDAQILAQKINTIFEA